ncbi:MAG: cobalamin-dependent protein [Pseudonocardiales bacterium]|nr:cobalamin-dependent protein [Pseudonocardiales bacterium]MBV9031674.1 cobalamin-dependent protein [Pseudonocardiales bacterium]MBW0009762.1 cobalamin-dependent protein [Pseudonocardiales bacterium]
MRILLIWPLAPTEPEWGADLGAVSEPLALEYLAAAAKVDSHDVRILDLRLHPDDLDTALAGYRPDLVGVTAYSMHVRSALTTCRRVRELLPGARTVVGGHHATFLPDDFFRSEVDYVVSGEGVGPLRILLDRLRRGDGVGGIPGLWARVAGVFTLGGPEAPFDVDALPVPDRSVTTADRHLYFIDWMRPVALLRTTVGCPFRCSFCSLWQLMGGRYHMRNIDAVVAELATIREDFVFFVDDEAFIHGPRMTKLAEAIAAAGIRKHLFAYCRIDSLLRHRQVLAAWKEIGLERIFVGIDAVTEKDLDEYRKKVKPTQIEEGLRVADELGIEIFAQFVVNTDYRQCDFHRLARFVEHHRIRFPTFTVLTPLPGTELLASFDDVVARQPNGRPNWDLFDCQHAVTATRLPPEEFHSAYRNLYRLFGGRAGEFRRQHVAVGGAEVDRSHAVATW